MATLSIHAFLIHPGKNVEVPVELSGKPVSGPSRLFDVLADIFHAPSDDKDFEVVFRPTDDGTQQNDCRDLIIAHQAEQDVETAHAIAYRLQVVTDRRSRMGLLFVMTGQHGTKLRTVVSRFPADEAILAEVLEDGLDVEFLEQVFIKKMSAYKAVLIEDDDPSNGYWDGFATDRQAGGSPENISDYWLDDFLTADFKETPKAGTRRLAEALKRAVKTNPVLSVKSEIASAVSLAPNALANQPTSIDSFCDYFGLSEDARDTIINQLPKASLSSKTFQFDSREFKKKVPYRTVEMKNGAMLTAPSDDFDKVFDVEETTDGKVRYSTTGKIADERVAGR